MLRAPAGKGTPRRITMSLASSDQGAAAVYCQDLAGYEIGFGEESYGVGYVFACAGAVEGHALNVIFVGGFARKLDGAGRDAVDQNFRAEGAGEAAREHDTAGFGDAVMREGGPGEQA